MSSTVTIQTKTFERGEGYAQATWVVVQVSDPEPESGSGASAAEIRKQVPQETPQPRLELPVFGSGAGPEGFPWDKSEAGMVEFLESLDDPV